MPYRHEDISWTRPSPVLFPKRQGSRNVGRNVKKGTREIDHSGWVADTTFICSWPFVWGKGERPVLTPDPFYGAGSVTRSRQSSSRSRYSLYIFIKVSTKVRQRSSMAQAVMLMSWSQEVLGLNLSQFITILRVSWGAGFESRPVHHYREVSWSARFRSRPVHHYPEGIMRS